MVQKILLSSTKNVLLPHRILRLVRRRYAEKKNFVQREKFEMETQKSQFARQIEIGEQKTISSDQLQNH